jgi:sugar (pentulose or hexulose) kinase
MSQKAFFIAIDLGSESGRCMLGSFDGSRFYLEEVCRFPNGPIRIFDNLYWDPLALFSNVKDGIKMCFKQVGEQLNSIAINTWGVDFVFLDRNDEMLSNPYHYRDARTDGMMEETFNYVSKEEIFERTGIQFMSINTIYQLFSLVVKGSPVFDAAQTFLTIPDLFNFWLSGQKVCEFSNATTTQLYDQREGSWALPIIKKLGIPIHIFPEVVYPGAILGPILPSLVSEIGISSIPVVTPVCHDTGSAVAGVPSKSKDFAFISSGTWSIVGVEVDAPIITPQTLKYNFTNEGGYAKTVRFSKNVVGLWLIQECRRTWAQDGNQLSYSELTSMAEGAVPFVSFIDPDASDFLRPCDMPARVRDYCLKTHQPVPEEPGALLRCLFESLALKYRFIIERIEQILDRSLNRVHIVGGGSKNRLLCQLTADSTNKQVIAGPVEATTFGNIIVQAIALGHIGSLDEGREVVSNSAALQFYDPRNQSQWDKAYERFLQLSPRV